MLGQRGDDGLHNWATPRVLRADSGLWLMPSKLGPLCGARVGTWLNVCEGSPFPTFCGSSSLLILIFSPARYLEDGGLGFSGGHKDDRAGSIQYWQCQGHALWRWLRGVTDGGHNLLPLLGVGGAGVTSPGKASQRPGQFQGFSFGGATPV